MGEALAKYTKGDRKRDREQRDHKPAGERAALRKIREEARARHAILTSGGEGGLPSSLVLAVFRRDKYRCKVHGDRGEGDHGGIGLHHKGGLENPDSAWLRKMGHKNAMNNLVTLCAKGHDEIHEKDRDEG